MIDTDALKREYERNKQSYTGQEFHRGLVVGTIKKACFNNDSDYRLLLKSLTGKTSSKLLHDEEIYALHCFAKPYKPPSGGRWTTEHGEPELERMCSALIASLASENEAQKPLF